eukprot:1052656-Karenia_brevis.AAC.1
MLLSSEELEAVHERGLPRTYMDPILKNSERLYTEFVAELFMCGVVKFAPSVKCECGIFFVRKKNDKLRLILDARLANSFFRTPPSDNMASTMSLGEVRARRGTTIWMSQYDVEDYFY